MRRALATVTIAGAVALVPFTAAAASTGDTLAGPVLTQSEADTEPLDEDGDDDSGKYGLIGLSGLFGLFGYKKYKEHRASSAQASRTTGTAATDSSSSRRV